MLLSLTSGKESQCFKKYLYQLVDAFYAHEWEDPDSPYSQITGLVLNQAHFTCPTCTTSHSLFGPPDSFRSTAERLMLDILAELPLIPHVSMSSDEGRPYILFQHEKSTAVPVGEGKDQWLEGMMDAAQAIWKKLAPV